MARVTVEDCVQKVPSRFELVLLAAQRAREISSGAPLTIIPGFQMKLGYDPLRDFTPITNVAAVPNVIALHPSVPARDVKALVALARAQGDEAEVVAPGVVRQRSWALMQGVPDPHPAAFACWNGLLEGALAAHDRFAELQVAARLDLGDPCFEWRIVPRRRA